MSLQQWMSYFFFLCVCHILCSLLPIHVMRVVLVSKGGWDWVETVGIEWKQARNTRCGFPWSLPRHYDTRASWMMWACGFGILLYYPMTPTKERYCVRYQVLIRNECWWFVWVTPLEKKVLIAFSPISHIHLPHTVLWPSVGKGMLTKGLPVMGQGYSFSLASLFPCTGTWVTFLAFFPPIILVSFLISRAPNTGDMFFYFLYYHRYNEETPLYVSYRTNSSFRWASPKSSMGWEAGKGHKLFGLQIDRPIFQWACQHWWCNDHCITFIYSLALN